MDPEQIALLIPIVALCIPISAIVTGHLRKMAEIKARVVGGLSKEVREELNEIKSQLANLRDTTTKFDMTFDAALSRIEERVDHMEDRQGTSAAAAAIATTPTTSAAPAAGETLRVGQRIGS